MSDDKHGSLGGCKRSLMGSIDLVGSYWREKGHTPTKAEIIMGKCGEEDIGLCPTCVADKNAETEAYRKALVAVRNSIVEYVDDLLSARSGEKKLPGGDISPASAGQPCRCGKCIDGWHEVGWSCHKCGQRNSKGYYFECGRCGEPKQSFANHTYLEVNDEQPSSSRD